MTKRTVYRILGVFIWVGIIATLATGIRYTVHGCHLAAVFFYLASALLFAAANRCHAAVKTSP